MMVQSKLSGVPIIMYGSLRGQKSWDIVIAVVGNTFR